MCFSVAQIDAGAQARDLIRGKLSTHPDGIFALEPVARMHHAVGERAVIRQDQQAAGVVIEAAHREPARTP